MKRIIYNFIWKMIYRSWKLNNDFAFPLLLLSWACIPKKDLTDLKNIISFFQTITFDQIPPEARHRLMNFDATKTTQINNNIEDLFKTYLCRSIVSDCTTSLKIQLLATILYYFEQGPITDLSFRHIHYIIGIRLYGYGTRYDDIITEKMLECFANIIPKNFVGGWIIKSQSPPSAPHVHLFLDFYLLQGNADQHLMYKLKYGGWSVDQFRVLDFKYVK